jgi:hypothetical protein
MDRRVGGALMLILALLAALVVPRALNPPIVDGAASIPPPPPPPPIGSCLKNASTSYALDANGVLEQAKPVQVVPCTTSHGSEVLFVDPDVTLAKAPSGGPTELDTVIHDCLVSSNGGWSYLGLDWPTWSEHPPPGEWSPSAAFGVGIVGPHSDQRAQGARWVACVIALPGQMLTVPLQGIVARSGGIPSELASCSVHTPGRFHVIEPGIACNQPHSMELFAKTSISLTSDQQAATTVSRVDLTTSCHSLAAAATGRLLANEPSLSVQVFVYDVAGGGLPVVQPGDIPPDARGWAECVITPADPDRKLAGSLRLIGADPLPWQP